MTKAERGMKRVCSGCGAKFYDLNKDPIVCPVCETVFVVKETARARPAAAPAEKPSKEVESPETEEEDTSGPEIVSLSEVEDEEDSDDDIDIDLGDDDAEIPDDDDDDTFLEDDEEEGSDVTDIIPGPVKSEGEEP